MGAGAVAEIGNAKDGQRSRKVDQRSRLGNACPVASRVHSGSLFPARPVHPKGKSQAWRSRCSRFKGAARRLA